MKLPIGFSTSFEMRPFLKSNHQNWQDFFEKSRSASDVALCAMLQQKQGRFYEEFFEFCESKECMAGLSEEERTRYPEIAARILRGVACNEEWELSSTIEKIDRIGRLLWRHLFDQLTDLGHFIRSLKIYLNDSGMDEELAIIFLWGVFSEKALPRVASMAADPEFPREWLPLIVILIPPHVKLNLLENTLIEFASMRRDFLRPEFFESPGTARHLMKFHSFSSWKLGNHTVLGGYLPSIVRGMMRLVRHEEHYKLDLAVYENLVAVQFLSEKSVESACQLLRDYMESLGRIEPNWLELVSKMFSRIEDPKQRKERFLEMAQADAFPEDWRGAYYDIAHLSRPFEEVVTEWRDVAAQLDLSFQDPWAPKFLSNALEIALPVSLKKWEELNFTEAPKKSVWEQQQSELADTWNILCDADWDLWAPLVKEYYISVILGYAGQGINPVQVDYFEQTQLSVEAIMRLSRLLARRKSDLSPHQIAWLMGLMKHQPSFKHPLIVIQSALDIIETYSAEELKGFMNRCMAIFFQNQVPLFLRQHMWLYLATALLEKGREACLQLVMGEKYLESWQGLLTPEMQKFFQRAAWMSRVMVPAVFSLYAMMGKVPFNEEENTILAFDYLIESCENHKVPIGSLGRTLDLVFGEESPFPSIYVDAYGEKLFNWITLSVSHFVPQTQTEIVQLLYSLVNQRMHRHFQGLYPLLVSICRRYNWDVDEKMKPILTKFSKELETHWDAALKQIKPHIPRDLYRMICPDGEILIHRICSLYMEALLTGKTS